MSSTPAKPRRLLVVMPSWLGDLIMATPTLGSLRNIYPDAYITALVRREWRNVLRPCPSVDRIITAHGKSAAMVRLARRLARRNFDTAILLPNSFRTALLAKLAGIDRRIGYARDGRGSLLTDRLLPRRGNDGFVPVSAIDYYLGIARYLGADKPDPTMSLQTRPRVDQQADEALLAAGWDDHRPLIILNPGANYGAAKMWPAERFAAVARACVKQFDATVLVNGAPKEQPIIDSLLQTAGPSRHIVNLAALNLGLEGLKSITKKADVMVTNDTGPRHIAVAFALPVVTIFGPTDPAWSESGFVGEQKIREPVYCSPCQKKTCPLKGTADELQCMRRIEPERVITAVETLLGSREPA